MNKTKVNNKWNAPLICFISFLIVFIILFIQLSYIALSTNVYGINMKEFASSRNTVTNILTAKRGTIYDTDGNVLAENISSYTLVAYLDSSITVDENNPEHVVDKEYTAQKLSTILGEEYYDYILERLNKKSKQVEFGSIGKNLTELTKLSIEELDLPGISFEETVKRYYPNGNFGSYIIGYAKQYTRINIKVGDDYNLYDYYNNYFDNYDNVSVELLSDQFIKIKDKTIKAVKKGTNVVVIKTDDLTLASIVINVVDYDVYKTMDTTIVGELGVESKYDTELLGVDGYTKYQQDKYGYKIPDTVEETIESVDGYDIYLTLDSNIQRFAENATQEIEEKYDPKWSIIAVMDAKSGEVLASSTSPSFNPNNLTSDMSYQNPLISYTYEPGSVMKIYTYMCAIETGLYDGEKEYLSGEYEFSDGTIIHDWNKTGWGYLKYDDGLRYSSNVAIINIIKDYLSNKKLNECLLSYGFNKKTGIELSGEAKGNISFSYETELMSAGFGQGISTTAIQQLQALTMIANDGSIVKPHIIKKIVNTNTSEETVTKIKKSEKKVSTQTINKIKDLMESVISPDSPTAKSFYLEGYNIIGKTGTAQIYENGAYLTGSNDYIVSVALMYPKEDPEIIIYAALKQPTNNANSALIAPIKELIQNISKYKSMYVDSITDDDYTLELSSYISKNVSDVEDSLSSNNLDIVVIGDGDKVVSQYPSNTSKLISGDRLFLYTNSTNIKLPNMKGWSRYDVHKYCELVGIDCSFEGYGYVVSQSISSNTKIDKNTKLEILLGS